VNAPAPSVLDASAQKADSANPCIRGRTCPECGTLFRAAHPRQIFCSPAHKRAWHNRDTVRGARLTTLAMAAHSTRGGTRGDKETGKRARRDSEQLMRQWDADDRAAGRMRAVEYVALRNRLGYDQ